MFGKGAPRCRRCAGAVYAAEEVIGAGQKWHTECFTCKTCRTRLSSTTLTEKDGEIYCATCYSKAFGPKGYGIGSQSLTYTGVSVSDAAGSKAPSASASASASSAPAAAPAAAAGGFCTGCGAANQGGRFCGGCGKPTGGAAAASSPSPAAAPAVSSPPPAVSSSFSPNRAIQRPGAVTLGSAGSNKCGACNTAVYDAEKVIGAGRQYHQSCFRCAECKTGLNSTNINDKEGKIFCNACYAKKFGPKGYGFNGGGASTFAYTQ